MGGADKKKETDACADLKTRIPELPSVMRRHGWGVASRLMERWLSMPANSAPDLGAHDTTTIRMDWLRKFERAWSVYATAKANRVWVNKAARKVIVDKLIDRKSRWPKEVGQRLEIGSVGEGLSLSGQVMLQFHKDWHVQHCDFRQSAVSSPIDELYGALGDFSFYFLVKGHVERIADVGGQPRYKVTLNKAGGYVRDSYDFNDGILYSQPLGIFGCKPKYIGNRFNPFSGERYYVNNADFRKWRKLYGHGRGGDFLVFSDIDRFNTNDSFVFPEAER